MTGTEQGVTSRHNSVNRRGPPPATNISNSNANASRRIEVEGNEEVTSNVEDSSNAASTMLTQILRRHPNPIAHPQQHVVLTCYIPPIKVGAVIGRQGKTILGVQRDASRRGTGSVRMSVGTATSTVLKDVIQNQTGVAVGNTGDTNHVETEALPEKKDDPWTPVKISGDPVGCLYAARLLVPLLETEMDDLVLDIPIHKSRHAAIIGRKGLTIAALSADHNVRIMVPKSNPQAPITQVGQGEPYPDATPTSDAQFDLAEAQQLVKQRRKENIVQLEGQVDNVEACLCKLLNIVSPVHTDKEVTFPAPDQPPILTLPPMIKISQVAKKTNTNIQRKRVDGKNGITPTPDDKTNKEEDNVDQQSEENSSQHSSSNFENRLVISGRSDSVDYAISILNKMISESTAISNNEPRLDEKQRGHSGPTTAGGRGRSGRKPYKGGRGTGRRRRGRGDMVTTGRGGNPSPVVPLPPKNSANS